MIQNECTHRQRILHLHQNKENFPYLPASFPFITYTHFPSLHFLAHYLHYPLTFLPLPPLLPIHTSPLPTHLPCIHTFDIPVCLFLASLVYPHTLISFSIPPLPICIPHLSHPFPTLLTMQLLVSIPTVHFLKNHMTRTDFPDLFTSFLSHLHTPPIPYTPLLIHIHRFHFAYPHSKHSSYIPFPLFVLSTYSLHHLPSPPHPYLPSLPIKSPYPSTPTSLAIHFLSYPPFHLTPPILSPIPSPLFQPIPPTPPACHSCPILHFIYVLLSYLHAIYSLLTHSIHTHSDYPLLSNSIHPHPHPTYPHPPPFSPPPLPHPPYNLPSPITSHPPSPQFHLPSTHLPFSHRYPNTQEPEGYLHIKPGTHFPSRETCSTSPPAVPASI